MAAQLQIFLFLFLVLSSSASARLLNVDKDVLQNPSVLVPCHTLDGGGNSNQETKVTEFRASPIPRFGAVGKNRKYGALVLNMLPKGSTRPSGPSKGTNTVKN